jgi:methyl-accepting chemotaxis protein
VLVAASPIRELVGDLTGTLGMLGLVLAGVTAGSLAVTLLVAADTRRTARRLRGEAERAGAGDLSPGAVIESDDELGGVAHAFAQMASSLGSALVRVRETSGRAEVAAQGLAQIGGAVREVTAAQVRGIEGAQSSVALVHRQAGQITGSAQALLDSVEDASSSVLELGAASEELAQTTVALSSQVEAVGSSIEQMVASVAHAGEHTEALGGAVLETTSSVAEMVRSMRTVDEHALETARLGTRVIELADGGRERVQETIRGMEAIRDATDSAQRLIDGLATRMREIGAVVGVIDDVADETNLLALNAAIIAAQAGDHGRAFSVVADEIKDLADRVLASTKEIGGLIRSVQEESLSAAAAIQHGADSVQSGVELSAQAGVALEDITGAARHAGERIQEIVQGMREQTRAAGHVEQLIGGVGQRLDRIREAGREQARGNEVVMRGSLVMRDVAQQTRRTTEEQSRGAERIRHSIESVRDAVERIHVSLQQQMDSCQSAVSSLGEVIARTRTNDVATDRLANSSQELQALADALRADMGRFRLE